MSPVCMAPCSEFPALIFLMNTLTLWRMRMIASTFATLELDMKDPNDELR